MNNFKGANHWSNFLELQFLVFYLEISHFMDHQDQFHHRLDYEFFVEVKLAPEYRLSLNSYHLFQDRNIFEDHLSEKAILNM